MEEFNILFSLALGLVAGLFMSRLMKPLGLPAVTSYLVAGILIGPFVLGRLGITGLFSSLEELSTMGSLVQDVALGFIAFAIGNEFKLSDLKHTGKQAAVVGVVQSVAAMIVVDAVLIGLHFALGQEVLPLSVAITLGATATATAPAATLMVVRQYKAKGPLTDILLPVVALDDAVGLICFSVSIGVARAVEGGAVSVISILVNPLLEVLLSLLLGTLAGAIFTAVESLFKSNSKRLCLSITFVLLTIALSQLEYTFDSGLKISFSSLLVCMMLGTLFCNLCKSADELMGKTDKWTMPLYVLFFVISGAELDFTVFSSLAVIGVGLAYVVFRRMIEREKERYGWEFLFLGANMDAMQEAARFGIGADRAVRFENDAQGVAVNYRAVSETVCRMRQADCPASIGAEWKEEIEADFQMRHQG